MKIAESEEEKIIDPNQQARKQASRLFYWVIPFAFVADYLLNVLTHILLKVILPTRKAA